MPQKPEERADVVTTSQTLRFRFFVTVAMRAILIRDGIAMWANSSKSARTINTQTPHTIRSGSRTLDARLIFPTQTAKAAVLILHGIGERLEYWKSAQEFLANEHIASLIIDYSGYGNSEGAITPQNLRQDVIASYAELQRLLPNVPPFILSLSLGTGIAVDAAPYLDPPPSGLILCEPFSSLRNAAKAVCSQLFVLKHLTQWLPKLMPDLYQTASSINRINTPLLIVHSDTDELFPVSMAQEIFAAASRSPERLAELAIPHGYGHNEAYLRPSFGYWQPILDFIHRNSRFNPEQPSTR